MRQKTTPYFHLPITRWYQTLMTQGPIYECGDVSTHLRSNTPGLSIRLSGFLQREHWSHLLQYYTDTWVKQQVVSASIQNAGCVFFILSIYFHSRIWKGVWNNHDSVVKFWMRKEKLPGEENPLNLNYSTLDFIKENVPGRRMQAFRRQWWI